MLHIQVRVKLVEPRGGEAFSLAQVCIVFISQGVQALYSTEH